MRHVSLTKKMSFTLACNSSLKTYVGELTAGAAADEVAVRHTIGSVEKSGEKDGWAHLAGRYGIKLDGIRTSDVAKRTSRLHLLGAYSGLTVFFSELEEEYKQLTGRAWKHLDKVSPFEEIAANVTFDIRAEEETVDYYRLCRNAIAHPSAAAESNVAEYFTNHVASLDAVRETWAPVGGGAAPNKFEAVAFSDVKMLARLALDVGKRIVVACDPGDDALARVVPADRWRRLGANNERRLKRIAGFLRTAYGLDSGRADRVAQIAIDRLA